MKEAIFKAKLEIVENLAEAGIPSEYSNPLLSWIKLVFADDQPNANHQGVSQDEFDNLIKSMTYMPIKADYVSGESELGGHDGAVQIGVIKEGQQEGNKLVAVGALYKDEFPEVVDFFKNEQSEGRQIDFSWEIRYKDSEVIDDVEWLKGTTTKAITAVSSPAYEGRTPLVTISEFDFLAALNEELRRREAVEVK